MSIPIADILKLIEEIIDREKQIEKALASEKDLKRRERLHKLFETRDLAAIRKALFEVDR